MTTRSITPVILCGGSGTRLWPISRKSFPKQFVPLIDGKSLFQLTLERLKGFESAPIVVTADAHRFLAAEAMEATGTSGTLILEPLSRNTAAAMALAALQAAKSNQNLLLFCPADHHIPDFPHFRRTVLQGVAAAASGKIVVFGVSPTFPSPAYGYIEHGPSCDDVTYEVRRFIEKPDAVKAQQLLLSGDVLWNAGIFLCSPDTLVSALMQHAPDILTGCEQALTNGTSETFPSGHNFIRPDDQALQPLRSESIDYAVMEHYHAISVVPFNGKWSDVGSWNAVAELSVPDSAGNRLHGAGIAYRSRNTFIHAPTRTVVALGVENLLLIDTPDAVLVAHRDQAELVKDVVAQLESDNCTQAVTHRKVARPWGWYDSLDLGDRFQVKRICVKAGASLSLQKHHHRAEHWVVVKGTAEVTRGDETFLLTENQSTYIPIGQVHRLKNPGMVELEIIEIQSGSYLGEDDIVRLDDTYGRARQ
jgi:mannose-1-phosphate guanylyltransferase / mannose-6-phosphate isomerase